MKEVGRSETAAGAAIYLSDGTINLGLTKGAAAPGAGLQVLGFQVPSVREVEQQIKKPLGLTYPGEPALEMLQPATGPTKSCGLRTPTEINSIFRKRAGRFSRLLRPTCFVALDRLAPTYQ